MQFIDALHRHENCTEFLHEFLDMIQHNMLVVDSRKRKPCVWVVRFLENSLIKLKRDKQYAVKKCPWRLGVRSPSFTMDVAELSKGRGMPLSSTVDGTSVSLIEPLHQKYPSRIPRRREN